MNLNQRLESYFDSAPQWLPHAFHNCAAANRVLKECAARDCSSEEMWRTLAGRMYELKNSWEGTAMNYARVHGTIRQNGEIPVIPS